MSESFTAEQIRESLQAFSFAEAPRRTPPLHAYIRHYACNELFAETHFAIGTFSHQGYTLVVQGFRPLVQPPRGTVVLVHGYMDHAALYRPLCLHLIRQGWQVLTYDLPGHGLSAGRRHEIDDFSRYADQLKALLQAQQEAFIRPLVFIGQSTGAAVLIELMRTAHTQNQNAGQYILLAPLVRPAGAGVIRWKYRVLRWFIRDVPRVLTANTSNAEFVRFVRERDPLQHFKIPVRWVGAMLHWADQLHSQPVLSEAPLIIQGEQDATVDWQYNLTVLNRIYPQAQVIRLPGARHNLANEGAALQQQVFSAIDQWLKALCPERKKAPEGAF